MAVQICWNQRHNLGHDLFFSLILVHEIFSSMVWHCANVICLSCYFHHLYTCLQDTKLLLWDLPMDEIVVPLRRSSLGGSPTFSTGSQSSHWDSTCPVGTLQPAPSMRDVPKLSPLVAHCVHSEPLSGLVFTEEAILTASWEGHVKIWKRPGEPESKSNSESLVGASSKDQPLTGKGYTELSKSKQLAESKSNNSKTLLGASSKDQQSLTSKGGVFNFKEMSKSSRLGYLP